MEFLIIEKLRTRGQIKLLGDFLDMEIEGMKKVLKGITPESSDFFRVHAQLGALGRLSKFLNDRSAESLNYRDIEQLEKNPALVTFIEREFPEVRRDRDPDLSPVALLFRDKLEPLVVIQPPSAPAGDSPSI